MNWDAIGAAGEVLGAVAVVVSLLLADLVDWYIYGDLTIGLSRF